MRDCSAERRRRGLSSRIQDFVYVADSWQIDSSQPDSFVGRFTDKPGVHTVPGAVEQGPAHGRYRKAVDHLDVVFSKIPEVVLYIGGPVAAADTRAHG